MSSQPTSWRRFRFGFVLPQPSGCSLIEQHFIIKYIIRCHSGVAKGISPKVLLALTTPDIGRLLRLGPSEILDLLVEIRWGKVIWIVLIQDVSRAWWFGHWESLSRNHVGSIVVWVGSCDNLRGSVCESLRTLLRHFHACVLRLVLFDEDSWGRTGQRRKRHYSMTIRVYFTWEFLLRCSWRDASLSHPKLVF